MDLRQLHKGQQIQESLENLRTVNTFLSNNHPDVNSEYWVSISSGKSHKVIKDEKIKLLVREYLTERIKELEEEFSLL